MAIPILYLKFLLASADFRLLFLSSFSTFSRFISIVANRGPKFSINYLVDSFFFRFYSRLSSFSSLFWSSCTLFSSVGFLSSVISIYSWFWALFRAYSFSPVPTESYFSDASLGSFFSEVISGYYSDTCADPSFSGTSTGFYFSDSILLYCFSD